MRVLFICLLGFCLGRLLVACISEPSSLPGPQFEVSVAPLTLPGVGRICYDLRVTDGATKNDPVIWSKGTPGLNLGASDAGALCSSNFGNGAGGDLTFVGACVSSPVDAGQDYRTNSVTLWIDGVYDSANAYVSPTGPNGWQNPCTDGCTLAVPCRENSDTVVEFNLTILREANQGFFDIGVNFEDIFCSAKVDCRDPQNEPLKLLFRPGTSTRDTTVVAAFACTSGLGAGNNTVLYRDPLELNCGGSVVKLDPTLGKGNAWTNDPNGSDAVFQYATYAGNESLLCSGQPCNKRYWNVAIGLEAATANCTLTTAMSASNGELSAFKTPASTTYPYIAVNVPLTGASGLSCTRHALDGSNGVSTSYTPISTPFEFSGSFDGTAFKSNAGAVIADGLLLNLDASNSASYPGSGTTWYDLSGNNRNGTMFGGVGYLAANGGTMTFDGTNDYVTVPLPTNFPSFSVTLWMKLTTSRTYSYAFSTSNGIAAQTFNIEFNDPDAGNSARTAWVWWKNTSGLDGGTMVPSTGSLGNWNDSVWRQVVFTHTGTSNLVYVNGALANQTITGDQTIPFFGGTNCVMSIGRREYSANMYYQGHIAQVSVYGRALSSSEVKQNFDSTKTRFGY